MQTWKDLTPGTRACGIPLGYAVRYGNGKSPTLEIVIGPDHLRRLKWKNREPLKLQMAGKQLRLVQMATHTRATRPLAINDTGRGYFRIPANGEVAEKFTRGPVPMTALVFVEATTEHLVFELPPEGKA